MTFSFFLSPVARRSSSNWRVVMNVSPSPPTLSPKLVARFAYHSPLRPRLQEQSWVVFPLVSLFERLHLEPSIKRQHFSDSCHYFKSFKLFPLLFFLESLLSFIVIESTLFKDQLFSWWPRTVLCIALKEAWFLNLIYCGASQALGAPGRQQGSWSTHSTQPGFSHLMATGKGMEWVQRPTGGAVVGLGAGGLLRGQALCLLRSSWLCLAHLIKAEFL